MISGKFAPVPPPAAAPIHANAAELNLLPSLRAVTHGGEYRCAACGRMQRDNAWMVWVPDAVSPGDPKEDIVEACRVNAFNGHHSGWCLPCAQALGQPSPAKRARSLWQRLFPPRG